MKIGLVIMSTASRSQAIINDKTHISERIELKVMLGEEQKNSTDVNLNQLFTYAKEENKIPHTSQPSPYEIEQAITNGLEKYDKLLIVTPHHTISGTYQSILTTVNNMECESDVKVIECNGGIAVTEVALIDKTLQYLNEGVDYQTLIEKVDAYNQKLITYCFPGDFNYLKISGRVKGAQALLLNMLNLRVVIKMADGEPILDGKGRGENYILKYIKNEFTNANIEKIFYTPITDSPKMRNAVIKLLTEMDIPFEITEEANSVPAAHLGPNNFGLGVAYK